MVGTQIRPLTTEDYHRMISTGIIHEDDRVELIAGQIFNMPAKGTRHTVTTSKLMTEILLLVQKRAIVRCQDPIAVSDRSEPEPDIVIAKLRADEYLDSHPTPEDIILVIEVADSSLSFDRDVKLPLYAATGINEYWLINLVDDRLEIYRQPEGNIYTNNLILTPPRSISIPTFPELTIDIAKIFPPPQPAQS
jgi:Uma2 family endonuclease